MNGQDLSRRFKAYPVASICGFVAILLTLVFYARGSGYDELRQRYKSAEQRWTQIEANVFKNSVNLETHLEMAEAISQDVKERLIRPSELARTYQYFYRLEGMSGVRITTLQQQPQAPQPPAAARPRGAAAKAAQPEGFSKVGYQMTVVGDFRQTVGFLAALERGYHLYSLNDFTLQRAREDDAREIVITMNFDLLGTP